MTNDTASFLQSNQKLWDDRVPVHQRSAFYRMDEFLRGENVLDEIVTDELGPEVDGRSLLHLQCHFGQDSLCLARMGARVMGVDFSEVAIADATRLNQQLGLNASFVQSDVYELTDKLSGTFDIVFTSFGAVCWLPDLERWAKVVAHFLAPGGIFYLAEFHPTLYLFDFDRKTIGYEYFNNGRPVVEEVENTYASDEHLVKGTAYSWQHSLHQVIAPLLREGLQLLDFQEFPFSPFKCFPNMHEVSPRRFVFGDFGVSLPHVYSLKMQKPPG
jgi:SAM-dependent methyltransferase